MKHMKHWEHMERGERGNIIFYVLIGIVLIGLLTMAVRNTGGMKDDINTEDMGLKAAQIQRYGAALAQSVAILLNNHISESELRFAHPDAAGDYGVITDDPTRQIFAKEGGKAAYNAPPAGVNDGSNWEFFATTAIPEIGSDKADLVAVLPHVSAEFCAVINTQLGFAAGSQPTDPGSGSPACIMGAASDRFDGSFNDAAPHELDDASFSKLPAAQACVKCSSDNSYNYFYVLMAR